MKEIGSEFWSIDLNDKNNKLEFLKICNDYKLLMSGQTAIDYVIHDFNDNRKIVYVPDYCCKSMLDPFIDNGYSVVFYNVDLKNKKYDIDVNCDCSVFFAMSYFGYSQSFMDYYIKFFSNRKIIVIEDITHRFLSESIFCKYSDYLVCSLRKWFPVISGGFSGKVNGFFSEKIDKYIIDENFVKKRKLAMNLKRLYIEGKREDKNEFLKLFSETNKNIEDYANKRIDNDSLNILSYIDIDFIRERRIKNSKIIHEMLKNRRDIEFVFDYRKGDVPLFVPVLLKKRDIVRKKLIENNIYCPVHWPNEISSKNEIYNQELSLICDQRYDENDIREYVDKLIELMGE